jgi:2-dehydro-3-deoxyphosphooctonate aldolase (KDO 8-P synthase)
MTAQKNVAISDKVVFNNQKAFVLIAGPCQIESREHAMGIAQRLADVADTLNIPFIFKASYDKANRTSISGQRGIGIDQGLEILVDIKKKLGCPVLTDVHTPEQCEIAAKYVDVLQVPAFLSRQTDMLLAAGKTGKPIHVKKGQFLAPWDMANVAKKIASTGNENIMLCERGTSFGYNTLVNDMRGLPIMAQTGYPVVYDATHSVQQPAGKGDSTGGDRTMVPYLARAAVAVGVAGVFIEAHDNPDAAPSDGPNMVKLEDMPALLQSLKQIDNLIKGL